MRKIHIAVVALLLGLAATLGTLAATRTVGLGASSHRAQDVLIQKRSRQLDAFEASLRRQLAQKAPALPAVQGAASAAAPRIVYHRPPPIIVTTHSHHGDDGPESEGGND